MCGADFTRCQSAAKWTSARWRDLSRSNWMTTGAIGLARVAFGGVAAMPMRARKTEQALLGQPWNEETLKRILPVLEQEFTPISDVRGNAAFRRRLITNLLHKFFHSDETKTISGEKICRSLAKREAGTPHESGHKHVTGEAIYVDDVTWGWNPGGMAGLLSPRPCPNPSPRCFSGAHHAWHRGRVAGGRCPGFERCRRGQAR